MRQGQYTGAALRTLLCGMVGLGLLLTTAAQTNAPTADGYKATATMRVPFAIDNTQAMMQRQRVAPPAVGLRVVPNILHFDTGEAGEEEGGATKPGAITMTPEQQLVVGGYWAGPTERGMTPSDANIAVGPNHVVTCVNGWICFYEKNGMQDLAVYPETFFAGLSGVNLCCDCRCIYDWYSGRWFIEYLGFDSSNHSYLELAVSDDSDPNGTWAKWALNSSLNGSTLSSNWSDYPGMGCNADVLMFTGNMFPISSGNSYGKIRVCPKQQFLDGNPTITWTDFWAFANPDGSTAFSLQPGRHIGACTLPVACNVSGINRLNVFAIQNALTTPSLSKFSVTVTSFGGPAKGVQPGSVSKYDELDGRVWDVQVRDNQILVTQNSAGGLGSRVKWYQVSGSSLPGNVSLVQQGTIENSSYDTGYASLQMNQYGTIGTGLTRSSTTEYISLYYTGREAGDSAGTMKPMTLKRASTVGYNGEANPCRWGDYCGGALDPADDFSFWAIGMIPTASWQWGTEVYSYTIGKAATLTGTANLMNFTGDPTDMTATVEFRQPGTTTVLHSYPITLDGSASYTIVPAASGTFDVAVKFSHWLRDLHPNVTIPAGSTTTLNFQPINGDAHQDNTVNLLDLSTLLTRFFLFDPNVDLNGDWLIDLLDLSIVLTNFGKSGPP